MEENDEYITYRINTKKTYKVYKNSYNGKDFYKIGFEKKNYDDTKTKFYRSIKFVKCQPPQDGDIIRIKKGFEDNYLNPKDKYNDVVVIVVMDYELIENEVVNEEKAYEKFQQITKENEMEQTEDLPF